MANWHDYAALALVFVHPCSSLHLKLAFLVDLLDDALLQLDRNHSALVSHLEVGLVFGLLLGFPPLVELGSPCLLILCRRGLHGSLDAIVAALLGAALRENDLGALVGRGSSLGQWRQVQALL